MTKKFICPICGYPDLEEAPLNYIENETRFYSYNKGAPTYEICPCCGIEFGYGDYEKSWEQIRKEWIESGYKWRHPKYKPNNWDPKKQLQNLEKISKEPYKAERVKMKRNSKRRGFKEY